MDVTLKLSTEDDAYILKNFWPLYVHDVSAFGEGELNPHGLLCMDTSTRSLSEQCEGLSPWWSEPGVLFPYLIRVNGVPAGFNLIAARSRLPAGIDADFVVHEFFVVHCHRSSGVAEQAAIQGFEKHHGRWEVVTYPNHDRGIGFWKKVLGRYGNARDCSEVEGDHPWGRRVVFRFDNSDVGTP